MKKRTGFVSNSSSSSFVIIGVSINEDRFDELPRDTTRLISKEFGLINNESGTIFVGKVISNGETYLDNEEFSVQEMLKLNEKIKSILPPELIMSEGVFIGTTGC